MTKIQSTKNAQKMKKPRNTNPQMKEKKLMDKIEKAKNDLARLQNNRRLEIGKMAYQHGLHAFSDDILEQAFAKLASELNDEKSDEKCEKKV